MVAAAVPTDEVAAILNPAAERVDRILASLGGGDAVFCSAQARIGT